jgi:ATP-dependent DNA helicase DinG
MALIEAGTGTGKTLAYLLPVITHALSNKERVVVSTNTINLQEQLINKDIPFVKQVLQAPFKAVLVKGRSNYACKRKLQEAEQDLGMFSEEGELSELKSIIEWSKTTKEGSRADLSTIPSPTVWEKVQSESDTSLKTKCRFYKECFFYQARRAAAEANLLIANHHLLFADLSVRGKGASENAVLPRYDLIVLDEAHNVEEVATSYFGSRVTYFGILRLLGRLYRSKNDNAKGLLPFLLFKLSKVAPKLPFDEYLKVRATIEEFGIPALVQLQKLLSSTMDALFGAVYQFGGDQNQDGDYGERKLRIKPELSEKESWQEIVVLPAKNLIMEIRRFTGRISGAVRRINELLIKMPTDVRALTVDISAQLDRLDATATVIEHILNDEGDGDVRWLEAREGFRSNRVVRLVYSPLNVAPMLKERVYEQFHTVIMTSATLTVQNSFDYMMNRLGLNNVPADRLYTQQLSAPFDYERQAVVLVPTDMPEPNAATFPDASSEMILDSIRASGGGTFVLFTSYGFLNKMERTLRGSIEELGFNLYKQGQENRHKLLERFKEDESSVLFGTDSFWEGVDVQGDSLRSVIITKLPFRVPSEPIVEARVESIVRGGGNAFYEYTVPQAVIKFKQGFGRLIRKGTDRGTILILDKRVVQKSYGRIFLQSLPPCRFLAANSESVRHALHDFFHAGSPGSTLDIL